VTVDLRDRVAIFTGGGRGIGRALALGYARAGAEAIISAGLISAGRAAPGGDRAKPSADRRHRIGRPELVDRCEGFGW
jgi:NAD(P)-dependent dehydrogenase (short-subunit alcohol dehydrogenase family)